MLVLSDPVGLEVGPDLDPNCLQKLSADNTSRQRVKLSVLSDPVGARSLKLGLIHHLLPYSRHVSREALTIDCVPGGGGGGGGTLIFSSYVGPGPASNIHPKKILGISSSPNSPKNI